MQHELGPGLEDIRKWSKMAEKYGNSEISSGKDISEIKATLNELTNQLDRSQLRAVTPERRTVQITNNALTRTHAREPLLTAPTYNYDPFMGQHLHPTPMYDVTMGERLHNGTSSNQRQESYQNIPTLHNRSRSPPYNSTRRTNDTRYNNSDYNRPSSSYQDNKQGPWRREQTPQHNFTDHNRSSSPWRETNQEQQYNNTYNAMSTKDYNNQNYNTSDTPLHRRYTLQR